MNERQIFRPRPNIARARPEAVQLRLFVLVFGVLLGTYLFFMACWHVRWMSW